MDAKLKNVLIVVAVIIGAYYLISPYENCMRGHFDEGTEPEHKRYICSTETDW